MVQKSMKIDGKLIEEAKMAGRWLREALESILMALGRLLKVTGASKGKRIEALGPLKGIKVDKMLHGLRRLWPLARRIFTPGEKTLTVDFYFYIC